MSEQTQEHANDLPQDVVDKENSQSNLEEDQSRSELQKEIEAVKDLLEKQYQAQILGRDRKITEQSKILEKEAKIKQSLQEQIDNINGKLFEKEIREIKLKELGSAGFKQAHVHLDRIKGETEEEIKLDVQNYKETWKPEIQNEINKKMAGNPPQAGKSPDNKAISINEWRTKNEYEQQALYKKGYYPVDIE